jgi:tetratricopeptide (TPR) repeat protein
MGSTSGETGVARLRHEAELALRRSRSRDEVEPLLERLEEAAEPNSEPWVFAHRHLAELRLESHPWRAALHLRKVLAVQQNDDVVHALLGLCHALLGNYQAAVGAYRRAVAIAPRNPWYHHNLGHLLDVALADPESAEPHLRIAHEMEPEEDEITASLAHCAARVGHVGQAEELAQEALRIAPDNADHQALMAWIEDGAPAEASPPLTGAGHERVDPEQSGSAGASKGEDRAGGTAMPSRASRGDPHKSAPAAAVLQALERGMKEAGFSTTYFEQARAIWSDFREGRRLRVGKPEVYAAAVEYAIALVNEVDGVTKASVARRYGIAPTSLSTRYGEIRDALSLRPRDSRYASSS